MVMRGVMEEKTNRIAEVIVSSVQTIPTDDGKDNGDRRGRPDPIPPMGCADGGIGAYCPGLIPHDTWADVQKLQQANAMGNSAVAKVSGGAGVLYQLTSALHTVSLGWSSLVSFLFYRGLSFLFCIVCRRWERR